MFSKKKNLLNGIFLVTVFVLTIYSVLSGRDLGGIAGTISETSPVYLFMGVGCIIFLIWAESAVLHCLFATLDTKTKRRACFLYSSMGFFFSCTTPSAGGGQPTQIYYMRKNMIPVPTVTVVLMAVTITYKFVLVVIGYLLAMFGQGFLSRYLYGVMPVYYLELGPNVVFRTTLLILAFHTSLARDMVIWLLGLLEYFHFLKKKTSGTERLLLTMEHYNDTATFLRQYKHVLLGVLFLTFCQQLALFSVTYFVCRTFELKGTTTFTLVLLQSVISVSADMLPLPRDIGISEHLLLTIFDPILYGNLLLPAMVLSRGITYYVQLGFNTVITMYVHLTLVRKHRRT